MANWFAQRLRQGLKITVRMIQENGMIPTSPGSHAGGFFTFIMCQFICCETFKCYSFNVSPNVVIVSGIMLNLETTRALSIYHLLYNYRNMSFQPQ